MQDTRTFSIGRSRGCDVILSDEPETVSRKHAELTVQADGRLFLTDCNSTNGTWLVDRGEGRRIRQEFVNPHDVVEFGSLRTTVAEMLETIRLKFPALHHGSPVANQDSERAPAQEDLPRRYRRNAAGEIVPCDD